MRDLRALTLWQGLNDVYGKNLMERTAKERKYFKNLRVCMCVHWCTNLTKPINPKVFQESTFVHVCALVYKPDETNKSESVLTYFKNLRLCMCVHWCTNLTKPINLKSMTGRDRP